MSYDLFISYSRADNSDGRIGNLVEQIEADFKRFARRRLQTFLDASEIHGMDDWRHRILQGLRESHILLACFSPSYLKSPYCEWEFNEYLKREISYALFGDGVAPIYYVEVPGWQKRDYDRHCEDWISELRRRQYFDLRPWSSLGHEALREVAVREQVEQLATQIRERVDRGSRGADVPGNVNSRNRHFVGRTTELRQLREALALGSTGSIAIVYGVGGVGKTELVTEYANAFAHEYGGGRWTVRCEGQRYLTAAVAQLAPSLGVQVSPTASDEDKFQAVLARLRELAFSRNSRRCLVFLDNVDAAQLLAPSQIARLPSADWLHVVATTRLDQAKLFSTEPDRAFVSIESLNHECCVELVESYQPGGRFADSMEREAAGTISEFLGRLTLDVELAAAYLGYYSSEVTCITFLQRLLDEGVAALDSAAKMVPGGVRHGESRLPDTASGDAVEKEDRSK